MKELSMFDSVPGTETRRAIRQNLRNLLIVTFLLLLCFIRPCWQLITFSMHDELFSYIPLIPFISIYLVWSNKQRFVFDVRPCWLGSAVFGLAGAAVLAAYGITSQAGHALEKQDYLSLMTFCFLCFFWGACLAVLGRKVMAQIAFPAAFLIFAVPLPTSWMSHIDTFFQYTSAATAEGFFRLCGTAVSRDGLLLRLPNFALTVAPECSGIHSTMVLFMVGWIAGYMFLNRAWQRAVLVLIVIPLAIIRNGFRICVVGELCVRISHDMINSPIHRKGGPLFFAMSLVPFVLILVFLRKYNAPAIQPIKTQPQPGI
ncbi:MAG: exosortase/archaeosortase family protein [Limisphaerales bacterium]